MANEGNATIQLRRGLSTAWAAKNPILADGEPGYETDTTLHKLGDGFTRWLSLPYAGGGGGDDSSALIALQNHINSALPHPVYDEGPSLALLYENAKV